MAVSATFRRNPQLAARIIDGLAFIITPDDQKLHTLNATATTLWELASAGCTADEAAAGLVERYEVDLETARRDVETCLEDLVARHILVRDA